MAQLIEEPGGVVRRTTGRPQRHWRAGAYALMIAISAALGMAAPALGDLKICNATSSRIGVAVGYQDPNGWATEGWWNIAAQTCETLLKGAVPSRFVYIHAVDYDRGGDWSGRNLLCTQDKSFAIRGVEDCQKRGHRRTGFFEIDTGTARDWTVRLTDPEEKRVESR